MGEYVEIYDIIDLFGSSDWEIEAKYTIYEAWLDHKFPTIMLSNEQIEQLKGKN